MDAKIKKKNCCYAADSSVNEMFVVGPTYFTSPLPTPLYTLLLQKTSIAAPCRCSHTRWLKVEDIFFIPDTITPVKNSVSINPALNFLKFFINVFLDQGFC